MSETVIARSGVPGPLLVPWKEHSSVKLFMMLNSLNTTTLPVLSLHFSILKLQPENENTGFLWQQSRGIILN